MTAPGPAREAVTARPPPVGPAAAAAAPWAAAQRGPGLGLRAQLLLASAAAVLLVIVVSAASAAVFLMERQSEAQRSRSLAIASALAVQLERILGLGIPLADLQGFELQCDEALARHPGLSFAAVVDVRGQVLFRSGGAAVALLPLPKLPLPGLSTGQATASSDGAHELVRADVRQPDGGLPAQVVVAYPRAALQAQRNDMLLRVAGSSVLALAVVLLLLHLALGQVLLRPLRRVVQAVARMHQGDRQAQVDLGPRSHDELTVLAEGFNRLVHTVDQRERELVAARDAAEEASRTKSQFLATMSHELRTPLNAVIGMADLLARSPLDERQRRLLDQVRTSGRLLTAIIADLLDLATIEAGKLRVAAVPYAVQATLVEAVERFRPEAEGRGLQLRAHYAADLPAQLVGDSLRVQQVLGNLLSNALKFTPQGGVVQVDVSRHGDGLRVAVSDTGIGIAPEFLPHLYEAFRQADGSTSRRFGGTGLGLSICRALCDAMGARIDVASTPGQGTRFWFDLPLEPPGRTSDHAVAAVQLPR